VSEAQPELKRVLNLPMLVLYGLGTTIGAGIYALVGEIAGVAGYGAPVSFLIASIVAGFTACSFAELAARYPRAAGAALYVENGFGIKQLSLIVGLLVILAGVVSAGAMINAFTGYLQEFIALDRTLAIVGISILLGAIAAWGIAQSVALAATITLIEVGGLVWVILTAGDAFATLPEHWEQFLPGADGSAWIGVLVGVTLSFYAYIGFEDMVDVAEEVKDVRRTMPIGILLTLAISTLLYLILMTSALLTMTPQALAATDAPLSAIYEANTGSSSRLIGLIAILAIVNGALIQLVMASRVIYGLSSRGQLPGLFRHINPHTQTPLVATGLATIMLLGLALFGHLAGLAAATSIIMLVIFTGVNLSLWRIKGRESTPPDVLSFPRWMPMTGALLSAAFVLRDLIHRFG